MRMGAEGWNTIARNSDSSSFGPFSASQRADLWLRGRGVHNALLLAPSIQGSRLPENHVQACPSETGGKQLLYHGRTRSEVDSAHDLLDKLALSVDKCTKRMSMYLARRGRSHPCEGAGAFWRSIIKFAVTASLWNIMRLDPGGKG